MPERQTIRRARKAEREGKAPTTQAGEFVREEIEHAMLPLAPLVEIADLYLLSQELRNSSRLTSQRRDDLLARDARHVLSQNAQESLRVAERGTPVEEAPRTRRRGG